MRRTLDAGAHARYRAPTSSTQETSVEALADARHSAEHVEPHQDEASAGPEARTASEVDTYVGMPVRIMGSALRWYEAFFGRPADEIIEDEALWHLSTHTWLFVTADTARAGGGLVTLGVGNLDEYLAWWAAGSLSHEPVETYENGVRHVTILDPDGNSLSLAEAPPAES